MSQKYEKLKTLLKELFQLDQPDLDFGLYRVMHAKSAEVSQFLDKDLLPQVQAAFGQYKTADKAEIEKELAKVLAGIESAGMDSAQSPKVKDLRARLANDAVDIGTLESEVYDHLFCFFRRYYDQGDFLAKRVYKPGVYSIPYEGEEVTLHWTNKDQYYIKTSEYLRDYAFRLRPDDDTKPMRVHFRLVDVTEGEHGNVKASEGKDRVFILVAPGESSCDFIAEEDGEQGKELVIRFEYRPATLTDWPEDARDAKSKPPGQKDLSVLAAQRVLAVTDPSFTSWIAELGRLNSTEKEPDRTVLQKHLKKYFDVNKFDYFIHKDLGSFLRRELDFYIKNEVMHLDDVENETVPRVEQYLSKIKVIRKIAYKIIAFLAQLEDFQKKLWLKKKFVVETRWCITVGCIPEAFHAEIVANEAQHTEWVKLFAIDEIKGDLTTPGYSKPLKPEFLKANPTLVADTRHFDAGLTSRLLEAIGDVDAQTDGVLFHSENFQALSVMQARCREQVKCIYIDPPYNTGSDGFAYKDSYQHSSWMSMLRDRVEQARSLLAGTAGMATSINDIESSRLTQLSNEVFAEENHISTLIWNTEGHTDNQYDIKENHEYIQVYAVDRRRLEVGYVVDPNTRKESNLWKGFAKNSITKNGPGNPYSEVTLPIGFPVEADQLDLPSNMPPQEFFDEVRRRGFIRPEDTQKYAVSYPIRLDPMRASGGRLAAPCRVISGWANVNKLSEFIQGGCVPIVSEGETLRFYLSGLGVVYYWKDREKARNIYSVLREMGTTEQMRSEIESMGIRVPAKLYPKPTQLISYLLKVLAADSGISMDYFAGSGTTGHAVINLNREDGGRRKFILVEMGNYFDTVLLPRIKKVTFIPEWKDGKPKRIATPEEAERSPRIVKVIRLESYEDALNNLTVRRTDTQQLLLDAADAQGEDGLKEQYLLRYMLNVETRGSQSLLNVQAFTDPTAYKLKVKQAGSDESREVNVDLVETFNWLIGITVKHIAAPQMFSTTFERDSEKRLHLKSRLKQNTDGPYWFRTVTGTTPDGRKTLIIWRKLTGEPEQDNVVLDEWFTKQGYSARDSEFDLIYVNGGNNLENLKTPDDTWKVRLIEEDFHRLMFETEGV